MKLMKPAINDNENSMKPMKKWNRYEKYRKRERKSIEAISNNDNEEEVCEANQPWKSSMWNEMKWYREEAIIGGNVCNIENLLLSVAENWSWRKPVIEEENEININNEK